MSTRHSLVVKAYRPWRYRITIAVLLVLAIASVTYAYNRGLTDGGYFRGEVRSERERMETELDRAERTESRLRDQVAVLERSQEIDRAARENLRRDVISLQDEVQKLEEELAFYRGIVSPEDGQSGLRIQDFSISAAREPAEFRYSLMLIQALSHDRRVEGEATLIVHGRQDGQAVSFGLDELSEQSERAFSFRYFEGLDGTLRLPADFEPEEVEVTVSPRGRNRSDLEQRFEWPSLDD